MNKTTEEFDPTIKQTIITLDNKKIKRTIQHVGQGIDSHVIYNGVKYDVDYVEGNLWKMIKSKSFGRYPNI